MHDWSNIRYTGLVCTAHWVHCQWKIVFSDLSLSVYVYYLLYVLVYVSEWVSDFMSV